MPIFNRRRSALGAATVLAVSLAVTGCGLGGSTASGPEGNGAPKPQLDCDVPAQNLSADKVDMSKPTGEIRFATQGLKKDFGSFFDPLIKKFEDAHPGTKINWEDTPSADDFDSRMVTDARTCVMADVINVPSSTIMALTQANLLVDFDNKIPGIGDRFIPGIWKDAGLGPNKHHTALPWYWAPSVVTYNKDLMKEAGLDPAKPPATVQELQAQSLTAAENSGGKIQSMWGNTAWSFVDQWLNSGVKVMNDDKTEFTFADDAGAQEWLSNMAKLYAAGAIPKDSVTGKPDPGQAYNEGGLIFGSPNPSFLRNVKKNAPDLYPKTGVSATLRDPKIGANFNGQFISVAVSTKNLPLAAAWADYVTSAESELGWVKDPNVVIFPTVTSVLDDPFYTQQDVNDPLGLARSVAAESAKSGVANIENFIISGKIQKVILQGIQLGTTGQKTPQDALKDAQTEVNKLFKASQS